MASLVSRAWVVGVRREEDGDIPMLSSMCGARWALLARWRAKQVSELARVPVVQGFAEVSVRGYVACMTVVLRAKALPDLVGDGDGGAHERRFPPWGRRRGTPVHSIA